MRVHFPSGVIGFEVDHRLVNEPNGLNVIRGDHELNTLKRTAGDKTGSVTRFGTPRDGLAFGFADGRGAVWWGPNAEILKIHVSPLTFL